MNAADIIGYAYDAAIHCVGCTVERFKRGALETASEDIDSAWDEHGLPEYMVDTEGNPVGPVFAGDEGATDGHCDDCHGELA